MLARKRTESPLDLYFALAHTANEVGRAGSRWLPLIKVPLWVQLPPDRLRANVWGGRLAAVGVAGLGVRDAHSTPGEEPHDDKKVAMRRVGGDAAQRREHVFD